ncbi:MAG TPA: uridine kinase [Actinocrinis sp.]|nr:uridine kinase [Actinocrinis sp.]
MHAQPISPALLVEHIADRITGPVATRAANPADGPSSGWTRVALDGPPSARAPELAERLAAELRLRGRAAVRVSAWDFLRPASLRLELGREDPDLFYTEWLDVRALQREVFGPLEPGGTGRVLPALWDAEADRAKRAEYVDLPPGGVLLLDGALLLGGPLPFDLTVHLWVSAAALARRTPAEEAWTLPAYARYAEQAAPELTADVVVRCDDPKRPALVSLP